MDQWDWYKLVVDKQQMAASPPSTTFSILSAVVIPIFAMFGCIANFINGIVFMRPRMTQSVFSYLAAVSFVDCLSCLLITLGGYAGSVFYREPSWVRFDYQWQTPLFGITTGAANLLLVFVTADRLIYLRHSLPNKVPVFCTRAVARKMIIAILLFSTVVNLPYFFIFVVKDDGTLQTTAFFHSSFYRIHNWIAFTLLGVVPGVGLLVGNTMLIVIFRKWSKHIKYLHSKGIGSRCAQKRYINQTKLITSIVIVVFLYMCGELPAHLTSKKTALNLLFNGDISRVDFEKMETVEMYCNLLNAIQLSLNIIVYAVINPAFMSEFFKFLESVSNTIWMVFCCSNCGTKKELEKGEVQHEAIDGPDLDLNGKSVSVAVIICAADNLADSVTSVDSVSKQLVLMQYNFLKRKSCMDLKIWTFNEVATFEKKGHQRHSIAF